MQIRTYQLGDEQSQAEVYNRVAGALPRFKPATAAEIARRYQVGDPDPDSKFYAVENGKVVGYAAFNPNGRISYPWCLPQTQSARLPLLNVMLAAMRQRGISEAWAAYRADWEEPAAFFTQHGFQAVREIVNYVAELSDLPPSAISHEAGVRPLTPADIALLPKTWPAVFRGLDVDRLKEFLLDNPYFSAECAYLLRERTANRLLGVAIAIADVNYADPTKIDPAMPCFRLGTLGTETERHKRINGMFSCVFVSEKVGEDLLAEAGRRLAANGLTHAAAQAASDHVELCAFYDRFFRRQGTFPIFTKRLDG